ncbi:hypothetical protein TPSD3_07985 [Thioflexithrix psekupsensis]|uniref:Uncharacterized protein n=2 Tax=Thioflexithrix psekupsensis TaxID=1570016 RepID=A0A251X8C7_9GAMM|nr:hypothetical protein TPSD3_07985 [Thioflexithrix psekupsensis]
MILIETTTLFKFLDEMGLIDSDVAEYDHYSTEFGSNLDSFIDVALSVDTALFLDTQSISNTDDFTPDN